MIKKIESWLFMSKVYYNSFPLSTLYSNIFSHFISSCNFFSLNFLKFLPILSLAMAQKESIIFSDLASFIAPSLGIKHSSAQKRILRFLSNPNYDFNFFYSKFISYIFSSFKIKHPDKKCSLSMDHMFIAHKFTILMISLKIGKQSIPLWFKVFDYHDSNAFSFSTFTDGINFCYNLIKSIDPHADIAFLADRFWGTHFKLMEYIKSLDVRFYIRTKKDLTAFVYDKHDKLILKKPLHGLDSYKYHSKFYYNIPLTSKHIKMNLAISKSFGHKEPFYILTNADPKTAIKEYSTRFGAIEFLFKGQKSNGFFLEETQIDDLYTFNSLYVCVCLTQTLMTIIGIDYSKNPKCYKEYKLENYRVSNGKRRKNYSFFHVGLILLNAYIFGNYHFKLFKRLILYDI